MSGHFSSYIVHLARGHERHDDQGSPFGAGEACDGEAGAGLEGNPFAHPLGGIPLSAVPISGPSGQASSVLVSESAARSGGGGSFPASAAAARYCLALAGEAPSETSSQAERGSGSGGRCPGAASGSGQAG